MSADTNNVCAHCGYVGHYKEWLTFKSEMPNTIGLQEQLLKCPKCGFCEALEVAPFNEEEEQG